MNRGKFESFSQEIQCLEIGGEIHKKCRIKSLDPQREDGFLVVGERLQEAQYEDIPRPYKTLHPKIIDSRHELAQLIVEEIHRIYHHPPTEHLHNQIRQEYWIIHGRHPSHSNLVQGKLMSLLQETGPPFTLPYPRRLEYLTIS